MVRVFITITSLVLGSGFVTAAEPLPGELPAETALVAKQLETAVEQLAAAHRKYDFVRRAQWVQLDDDQRMVLLVKLAACEADVIKARDGLRLAVVELRLLALKTTDAERDDWRAEWFTKLADRSQRIIGDKEPKTAPIPQALAGLGAIRTALEKDEHPKAEPFGNASDGMIVAARDAASVLRELDLSLSKARLREMLKEILVAQEHATQQHAELKQQYRPHPSEFGSNSPTISESPVIVLEMGGRVGVSHAIYWRKYKEDELEVTLTASDPSLMVPAKIKLEFEKHQFRFDYEIKAGDKAGEFTITLQPAAGGAVQVKVTVK